jgi:hypothetical protein
MRRREFLTLLGATFAAWPQQTSAQPKSGLTIWETFLLRADEVIE